MLEDLVVRLTPWFEDWGLLILFGATFLESSIVVASVVPGESVLLLGGFLSSPSAVPGRADPPLDLPEVISVAFAGAFLGDIVGYLIGRWAGRTIVRRFGRFILLSERRMPILESYFTSYGGRAILLGRFAPFLRSVRTLVAGTARMPFGRFLLPDVTGAAAWTAAIGLTGFLFGESWVVAKRYLGAGGIVAFVLLAGLFVLTWRQVRVRVERELAAQAAPPGAFAPRDEPPNAGDVGS